MEQRHCGRGAADSASTGGESDAPGPARCHPGRWSDSEGRGLSHRRGRHGTVAGRTLTRSEAMGGRPARANITAAPPARPGAVTRPGDSVSVVTSSRVRARATVPAGPGNIACQWPVQVHGTFTQLEPLAAETEPCSSFTELSLRRLNSPPPPGGRPLGPAHSLAAGSGAARAAAGPGQGPGLPVMVT